MTTLQETILSKQSIMLYLCGVGLLTSIASMLALFLLIGYLIQSVLLALVEIGSLINNVDPIIRLLVFTFIVGGIVKVVFRRVKCEK